MTTEQKTELIQSFSAKYRLNNTYRETILPEFFSIVYLIGFADGKEASREEEENR
jgi:hypothetical protein